MSTATDSVSAEVPVVTTRVLKDMVRAALVHKCPIMVWGPPGSAKSASVRQVADEEGIGFIDLRLGQIDAVDLRGLPAITRDEQDNCFMTFAPSKVLPRDGRGILFLDEIAQAPMLVKNAASELILDRRCGEYILPEGWIVVSAANRMTDRAGTTEMPSHMKNRMIHVSVGYEVLGFLNNAEEKKYHKSVISFVKQNPKLVAHFKPDQVAYPTFRTWEYVSKVFYSYEARGFTRAQIAGDESFRASVQGALGRTVASQLFAFLNEATLPTLEEILANPTGVQVPDTVGPAISQLDMLTRHAKTIVDKDPLHPDVTAIVKYMDRNLDETATATMFEMLSTFKSITQNPAFKASAVRLGIVVE